MQAETSIGAEIRSQASRRGCENKKLIDCTEFELERMGLKLYSDNLKSTYNEQPLSPTKSTVIGQVVDDSAYAPTPATQVPVASAAS